MTNNGNGNGKKIEVSLDKDTNQRLSEYSEQNERSINSIVKESVQNHLDSCDTKKELTRLCQDGNLRSESKVCRKLEHEE
jgi:hypothetical protein